MIRTKPLPKVKGRRAPPTALCCHCHVHTLSSLPHSDSLTPSSQKPSGQALPRTRSSQEKPRHDETARNLPRVRDLIRAKPGPKPRTRCPLNARGVPSHTAGQRPPNTGAVQTAGVSCELARGKSSLRTQPGGQQSVWVG